MEISNKNIQIKKITNAFLLLTLGFMVYSNLIKKERVIYMSVDIPGKQMAATIPPFGIFIEGKYNKYWNREWYDFKLGLNYTIF